MSKNKNEAIYELRAVSLSGDIHYVKCYSPRQVAEEIESCAFKRWTAKEVVIKATGKRLPLSAFL